MYIQETINPSNAISNHIRINLHQIINNHNPISHKNPQSSSPLTIKDTLMNGIEHTPTTVRVMDYQWKTTFLLK